MQTSRSTSLPASFYFVITAALLAAVILAFFVGWGYAIKFPLPAGAISLDVPEDAFKDIPNVGFLPSFNVWGIMFHNLRVLVLRRTSIPQAALDIHPGLPTQAPVVRPYVLEPALLELVDHALRAAPRGSPACCCRNTGQHRQW